MRRTFLATWIALVLAACAAVVSPAHAATAGAERMLLTFDTEQAAARALARFGGVRVGAQGWAGMVDPALAAGLKDVAYVGRDGIVKAANTTPNDPCVTTCQTNLSQWYLPVVQAPSAWDRSKGGGVTIAILDSGVDATHPDLAPKMVAPQINLADDNLNGEHGTKVAGVAAAATNNGVGVAALGWNAGLLSIKVLDAQGEGFTSAVVNGINEAANRGAKIINLSLATTVFEQPLQDAITAAYNRGVLVVAAAGNNDEQGGSNTSPKYPAAMDHVLSVAATAENDAVAQFSRRGPWVDMAAPGNALVTTSNGGGYAKASGTSMASPMVAGAAALLVAQGYETSPDALTAQLVRTGQPINDGVGGVIRRLNAGQATETTSPYGQGFPGGTSVAVGELDAGFGGKEILTGAGPGGGPHVRMYTAQMNPVGGGFFAFSTSFHGGADLAVGDVLPDLEGNEIVAAAGPGGGPHVRVFTAQGTPVPGTPGSGFFAYGGGFSGGVSVAVGDVLPENAGAEIITGVFSTGGPHVRVFSANGTILHEWYAFDGGFQGGVTVAVGTFDAVAGLDIAVAAGPGAGPHVKIFHGDGLQLGSGFYAYASGFTGGVDVAAVPGGLVDRIVTVPRGFGGPHVRLFNATGDAVSGGVFAFEPSQTTGLSIAAGDNQVVIGTRSTPDLARALPLSALS